MLSFEQIEALEAFDASDARVLSAYLRLDPGRQSFGVVFENLVKTAHDTLDVRARRDLLKEAADVERWLSDQKPRGTALAVFSCAPRGLWQHHWLAVPVDNHLAFEPKPDIAPLLAIADDYERYVVALVDKRHARLLSVFAGEIEEADSFDDPVPGKHDQGAIAQSRFQRHHESHVHWPWSESHLWDRRGRCALSVGTFSKEAAMKSRLRIRTVLSGAAVAVLLVLANASASARAYSPPERYTAFAVDMGFPGRTTAGPVEFVIERYSTDEERDRLIQVLLEKGPEKLLDALQSLPRIGYFRTPNSIGYDIRFARKYKGEDGGDVITMMTDRYIGFWEAANRPRTVDYPFTLIEIRIGPDGTGEGKMSIATKVTYDKKNNTIVLEDYKSQPVILNQVKKES